MLGIIVTAPNASTRPNMLHAYIRSVHSTSYFDVMAVINTPDSPRHHFMGQRPMCKRGEHTNRPARNGDREGSIHRGRFHCYIQDSTPYIG